MPQARGREQMKEREPIDTGGRAGAACCRLFSKLLLMLMAPLGFNSRERSFHLAYKFRRHSRHAGEHRTGEIGKPSGPSYQRPSKDLLDPRRMVELIAFFG